MHLSRVGLLRAPFWISLYYWAGNKTFADIITVIRTGVNHLFPHFQTGTNERWGNVNPEAQAISATDFNIDQHSDSLITMSSTDLLHQPERRNRSEIHLTTTLEHSEQEHGVSLAFITQLYALLSVLQRSQTPNPQSNRRSLVGRAKDRAKDLFKPKALRSHDSSGRRSAVNPREDVDSFRTDKVCTVHSVKSLQRINPVTGCYSEFWRNDQAIFKLAPPRG